MKRQLKKVTLISALAITLFSVVAFSIPLLFFSMICLLDVGVLQKMKGKEREGGVFNVV